MKNLILILLFIITLSCTSEPEEFKFYVSLKNNSTQKITIDYYSEGLLLNQIQLNDGESGLDCNYQDENFAGYQLAGCLIDSLKFVFDNGKGYLTSINYPTPYEFDENNGLFGPGDKFINLGNKRYEFVITEEDFNNAHELPE